MNAIELLRDADHAWPMLSAADCAPATPGELRVWHQKTKGALWPARFFRAFHELGQEQSAAETSSLTPSLTPTLRVATARALLRCARALCERWVAHLAAVPGARHVLEPALALDGPGAASGTDIAADASDWLRVARVAPGDAEAWSHALAPLLRQAASFSGEVGLRLQQYARARGLFLPMPLSEPAAAVAAAVAAASSPGSLAWLTHVREERRALAVCALVARSKTALQANAQDAKAAQGATEAQDAPAESLSDPPSSSLDSIRASQTALLVLSSLTLVAAVGVAGATLVRR
jgi:hypothetical protein